MRISRSSPRIGRPAQDLIDSTARLEQRSAPLEAMASKLSQNLALMSDGGLEKLRVAAEELIPDMRKTRVVIADTLRREARKRRAHSETISTHAAVTSMDMMPRAPQMLRAACMP